MEDVIAIFMTVIFTIVGIMSGKIISDRSNKKIIKETVEYMMKIKNLEQLVEKEDVSGQGKYVDVDGKVIYKVPVSSSVKVVGNSYIKKTAV